MHNLPGVLAAYTGTGYVKAPAGYGKTHLIAEATGMSNGRQLILTHTYAGVSALQRTMRLLGVDPQLHRIDTIASWSLRICLSYSSTSGWTTERPQASAEWDRLYETASQLLEQDFIQRIIQASYDGLYVDEYQDCSLGQHQLVLKLARELPCRILGDPLQGIFGFGGQAQIDWEHDVETGLEYLGKLQVPHRWNNAGAVELGEWLNDVRVKLETNQPIDLEHHLPRSVTLKLAGPSDTELRRKQVTTCQYFQSEPGQTVIAIHAGSPQHKNRGHALARSLGGRFTSIEEIEGKALFSFILKLEKSSESQDRLLVAIEFAKQCMTAVDQNLAAGTRRGERVTIRNITRSPAITQRANSYLDAPTSYAMREFLQELAHAQGVNVVRGDLYYRAIDVLTKHTINPEGSLQDAAENYHREFRFRGRPIRRRKQIGSTLLVKGLEFHHAIVLDAETLSRRELYVALTRGAKSLTIVSTAPTLNPKD